MVDTKIIDIFDSKKKEEKKWQGERNYQKN